MIKKKGFSKRGNILIASLVFFMFFTDTLYAFEINPKSLEKINFVNITAPVASAPLSSATADVGAASSVVTAPFAADAEEDADADDEKEVEDASITGHESVGVADPTVAVISSPAAAAATTPERRHKVRKYRDRLFLGEADFSFTSALIKKHEYSHPDLPKYIVATELGSLEGLAQCYPDTFFEHMANLNKLNMVYKAQIIKNPDGTYPAFSSLCVWVCGGRRHAMWNNYGHYSSASTFPPAGILLTGVDATKLHEIFPVTINQKMGSIASGFHFERIHFNYPMSLGSAAGVKELIIDFFKSASKIQVPGDRVHLTVPNGFEGYYDIFSASAPYYRVVKKHRFTNRSYPEIRKDTEEDMWERYPGYKHGVNVGVPAGCIQDSTKQAVRDGREYVFERVNESGTTTSSSPVTDDDSSDYDYPDDAEGKWYAGERINELMDHYFGLLSSVEHPDTQDLGLGRMHAINIEALDGDVFLHNLAQRETAIETATTDAGEYVPQLLIPVNIGAGEGNHWAGLYIYRVPDVDGVINIFYFDPLGNPIPQRLQDILRKIYGGDGGERIVNFYENNHPYQEDGCNCGPWVIEFFRRFMPLVIPLMNGEEIGVLFPEIFNIEAAREEHENALTIVDGGAAAAVAVPVANATVVETPVAVVAAGRGAARSVDAVGTPKSKISAKGISGVKK
ncbi:MAG: hypothetical protein ACD_21C00187G0004 [uncultured bacterium]|nr:MAG: hypothetical protein ACD_21C00187G0004 [uncultured bacterium]